jgi:hypothetical protein
LEKKNSEVHIQRSLTMYDTFFFVEYAGELRIIALRRQQINYSTLTTLTPTHT